MRATNDELRQALNVLSENCESYDWDQKGECPFAQGGECDNCFLYIVSPDMFKDINL